MLKAFYRPRPKPLTIPPFRDGDLSLLPIQPHHARPLFAIVDQDRAYLRQWQNWPDHMRSLREMQGLIANSLNRSRHHIGCDAVIYYQRVPAGKVGFVYIDDHQSYGEIGYWLAQRFQGYGLVTRAARFVTDFGFGTAGLSEVRIRVAEANRRSRAIPERLGFRSNLHAPHTVWIHGVQQRELVYSMSRETWCNQMIYHITTKAAWKAAMRSQTYRADSLETQGFIHTSGREQITRVADAVYRGQRDLVLLVIDPEMLQPELRWEAPDPTIPAEHQPAEQFPHIYGPVNTDAVIQVVDFPAQRDGSFTLPKLLAVSD